MSTTFENSVTQHLKWAQNQHINTKRLFSKKVLEELLFLLKKKPTITNNKNPANEQQKSS